MAKAVRQWLPLRLRLPVATRLVRLWEPVVRPGGRPGPAGAATSLAYGRWRRVRVARPYYVRGEPLNVRIRPFEERDYPRLVVVQNAAYPTDPESEAELRHYDTSWDHTRYERRRWVAEVAEAGVVGWARLAHMPYYHHPNRYRLDLAVDPAYQRRGVGTRLYDHCLAELTARGAELVRCTTQESLPHGVSFLTHRGFVEMQREAESHLDVTSFDFARFAGADERAAAQGITLTNLAAERGRDAEALRKTYDLYHICDGDVPAVDDYVGVSFERFVADEIDTPRALLDAFFLARDGDRYVGLSQLGRSLMEPGVIFQGLTGVLPEYRGRGIAMALKLATVRYARAHGYHQIRTGNDVRNAPMLRINRAMGFVKQPDWIEFDKTLGPATATPTPAAER